MKKNLLFIAALIAMQSLQAQDQAVTPEVKPIKVEIHGFVGVDAYYDTRQSAMVRNGSIYLWPQAPSLDMDGNDINEHGYSDIDAAHSRVGIHITGPDAFGAKSFAMVEGDFLGKSGATDVNFRLRHAFVRLNWTKTTLTVGQTWHPLFLTENYPETVNLNSGAPYHPLNRAPQIKLGHQITSSIEVLGYLLMQNDFTDANLPTAAAQAVLPEVDGQVKFKNTDGFFAALTVGYKTLQPALSETIGSNVMITNEKVQSMHVAASVKQTFDKITVKAEGIYGGAMSNLVMIGGVATKAQPSGVLTEYVPINIVSTWFDISSNAKKIQPSLMVGYTQNMGASENATPKYTLLGSANIANLYSICPRVRFYGSEKVVFGLEWLYTVAAYGTPNEKAVPKDTKSVANSRILASLRYNF